MTPDDAPPVMMNVREVAEYLHCHTSTVYRLVKIGGIPAFRFGIPGDWKFRKDLIDQWMEEKRVKSAGPSRI